MLQCDLYHTFTSSIRARPARRPLLLVKGDTQTVTTVGRQLMRCLHRPPRRVNLAVDKKRLPMSRWLLTRRNALRLATAAVPAASLSLAAVSGANAATPPRKEANSSAGSASSSTSDAGTASYTAAVLIHDGTSYPPRPSTTVTPAGWATYKGPTQPADWLANDDWENNT